jgi:transcriptional regulator with XRE-family HTH domain
LLTMPRSSTPAADTLTELGRRLRDYREALTMNQAEFAKGAGLAVNTYNQWEQGKKRPDVAGAARICDAHGLTLDYIYRGKTDGLPVAIWKRLKRAA